MTGQEFIDQLAKGGGVEFENSRLKAPPGLARLFVGPLAVSQPVHYGLEASRMAFIGGALSGLHEWWLILDAHLLQITAKMAEDTRTLTINHRIYSSSDVTGIDLRTDYQAHADRIHLKAARLQVSIQGADTLSITAEHPAEALRPEPEAVVLFAQYLLTRAPDVPKQS